MSDPQLESIRQAVNSEDYARAHALWNECMARLSEELGQGRLTDCQLRDVRELVEWSRMTVMSARAHMRDELNGLHVAEGYQATEYCPSHDLVDSTF